MRTKSRVRGSIGRRASAGKKRLCRSMNAFTWRKSHCSAVSRQSRANSSGSSTCFASSCHASPSWRSCWSIASSIARRRRIQASGPPSARTADSASGRKLRGRSGSARPFSGLSARSVSSTRRSSRSRAVSGRTAPWLMSSFSSRGSTSLVCPLHGEGRRRDRRRGGARRRGGGATSSCPRPDQAVPGRRAEDGRTAGRGVRRGARRPRRADEAAHARRARHRARRQPGRRPPAHLRVHAGEGRGRRRRQCEDRRAERRDRGGRGGLPLDPGRARADRAAGEHRARRKGRTRQRRPARARGDLRARGTARARPSRRRADQQPDDAGSAPRGARAAAPAHRHLLVQLAVAATAPFGADVLERLAATHDVVQLLTRPDAPRGRGRRLAPSPAKETAERLGIPITHDRAELAADTVVVCAYGLLIPESALERALWLNVHPSLLPRWRGAAPVERALMAGDLQTGVTIHRTTKELDAGPIAAQEAFAIGSDDDAGSVYARAAEVAARLLDGVLPNPTFTPQPDNGVTYAEKIAPGDRELDPSRPAQELVNRVRALSPYIGARLGDLIVWQARADDGEFLPLEVQPPGGKRMAYDAYLRGRR